MGGRDRWLRVPLRLPDRPLEHRSLERIRPPRPERPDGSRPHLGQGQYRLLRELLPAIPVQSGASLVFRDTEPNAGDFPTDTISIGDINNHETDSFRVELPGGEYFAVGLYLFDSTSASNESFRVYGEGNVLLGFLPGSSIPSSSGGGHQFVGAVADEPIHFVRFVEGAGGDDIAVQHFRFACVSDDLDSDGLDALQEMDAGTDPLDDDSDDDGLGDGDELSTHGTNPLDADSDDDGLGDGDEFSTHGTSPIDPDSDDDGLGDGDELSTHGTSPIVSDTDNDGTDGRLQKWSSASIHWLRAKPSADPDGDGLDNLGEQREGANPHDPDSDDDGIADGLEPGESAASSHLQLERPGASGGGRHLVRVPVDLGSGVTSRMDDDF